MNSSIHVDNNGKDILILGKGPTQGLMMMFDIYAYVHRHVGPTAAASAHSAFRQQPFRQPLHHTKPWLVGYYYKYVICNT